MTPRLTTRQAAEYLNVSAYTMKRWRREGVGPEYVKVGSRFHYPIVALERYLASRTVTR